MTKRSKPFTATPDQILMLEDILLQLAARSEHPEKYGLTEDERVENNEALDCLNQLMAKITRIGPH